MHGRVREVLSPSLLRAFSGYSFYLTYSDGPYWILYWHCFECIIYGIPEHAHKVIPCCLIRSSTLLSCSSPQMRSHLFRKLKSSIRRQSLRCLQSTLLTSHALVLLWCFFEFNTTLTSKLKAETHTALRKQQVKSTALKAHPGRRYRYDRDLITEEISFTRLFKTWPLQYRYKIDRLNPKDIKI